MTPAQRTILNDVAERRNVTVSDLLSRDSTFRVTHARHEAMFLMRRTGLWSWVQIGAVFGRHRVQASHGARQHQGRARAADAAAWSRLGERRAA